MLSSAYSYSHEQSCHNDAIEVLNARAFGPGRHVRAAARIREQGPCDLRLCFVCVRGDVLVGSVRMTPVWLGEYKGYLLGPLAVSPDFKNQGIGRKLVNMATDAAARTDAVAVLLVGDAPYYSKMGFYKNKDELFMPGPVDKERVLVHQFDVSGETDFSGQVIYRDLS